MSIGLLHLMLVIIKKTCITNCAQTSDLIINLDYICMALFISNQEGSKTDSNNVGILFEDGGYLRNNPKKWYPKESEQSKFQNTLCIILLMNEYV